MLALAEVSLPAGLRPSRLELHDDANALGLETVRMLQTWEELKREFAYVCSVPTFLYFYYCPVHFGGFTMKVFVLMLLFFCAIGTRIPV